MFATENIFWTTYNAQLVNIFVFIDRFNYYIVRVVCRFLVYKKITNKLGDYKLEMIGKN